MYNFIQFYNFMLPYVCFLLLHWVKFCCVLDRFFYLGDKIRWLLVALGRRSSNTVWEFTRANSALFILGGWLLYRSGRLNRFDCTSKKGLMKIFNVFQVFEYAQW